MEFLALIHSDQTAWEGLSDEDRDSVYERYGEFARAAEAAGVLRGGGELEATTAATTVRRRHGKTLVSDGPYAEIKEALGGYFLLECRSMDEALDWASRIPAADHGAIEIRPVHVETEGAAA